MTKILRALSPFAAMLVLSIGVFAQSQTTTTQIQGTVLDPNGAVVAGADVTVKNAQTGFERTVSTNSDGFFTAPLLPLGTYRVTVKAQGFGETNLENIETNLGQTLSLKVELKLGGTVETVDVSAEPDSVEIARTELSTQIDERSVENLPINRRDFSRFALLTPRVSIVQGPDGDEISINGQKGIQNNITIDGADANNPFLANSVADSGRLSPSASNPLRNFR